MIKEKFYTSRYEPVFYYCVLEDRKILKAILELILKEPVYSLIIKNIKLTKQKTKQKGKEVDVLLEVNGKLVNIEINTKYSKTIRERNASYLAAIYNMNLIDNKDCENFKPAIQINLNFKRTGKGAIVEQVMQSNNHILFTEKLKVYEVNIDMCKKLLYNENGSGLEVLAMLDMNEEELLAIQDNPIVERYRRRVVEMNKNKNIWETDFFAEQDAIIKRNNERKKWKNITEKATKRGLEQGIEQGIVKGFEKGIEQGIEQGIEKGRQELIMELLDQGVDPNLILKCTNLRQDNGKQLQV